MRFNNLGIISKDAFEHVRGENASSCHLLDGVLPVPSPVNPCPNVFQRKLPLVFAEI